MVAWAAPNVAAPSCEASRVRCAQVLLLLAAAVCLFSAQLPRGLLFLVALGLHRLGASAANPSDRKLEIPQAATGKGGR